MNESLNLIGMSMSQILDNIKNKEFFTNNINNNFINNNFINNIDNNSKIIINKSKVDDEERYTIDDVIKILKQLENNKYIKPIKNLMNSRDQPTRELIKTIIKMCLDTIIKDETNKIDMEAINKIKKSGFLVFPKKCISNDTWLDIVICTKKGQIRF